jgi:hypothetical protein
MGYEKAVHRLPGGGVLVACGPMRLTIFARLGRVPQTGECLRAADAAVGFLERIAAERPLLDRARGPQWAGLRDPLTLKMAAAVRAVGDADLGPMAAVAGTIADAVADLLAGRGMRRVIVENGGDIAVRNREAEPVTVGIRTRVDSAAIARVLTLEAGPSAWGVATSGLGGRSLTRGVADAAVVAAADAAVADAAATAVANASFVEDPAVERAEASRLDPHTDIAGLLVTRRVGRLPEAAAARALDQALRRAGELAAAGVIVGAFVSVQGRSAATPAIASRLSG